MKVSNIGVNQNLNLENKNNKSKLSFNESFNQLNRVKTKEEIESYLKEIKLVGQRIVSTQNYNDVVVYKKVIKDYLKSVVDHMYSLNKNTSFWEGSYFKTVKIVNEKLEDITRQLIYDQQENIDIASSIDEINGLLLDIYM